jgi:hypothetical protein
MHGLPNIQKQKTVYQNQRSAAVLNKLKCFVTSLFLFLCGVLVYKAEIVSAPSFSELTGVAANNSASFFHIVRDKMLCLFSSDLLLCPSFCRHGKLAPENCTALN